MSCHSREPHREENHIAEWVCISIFIMLCDMIVPDRIKLKAWGINGKQHKVDDTFLLQSSSSSCLISSAVESLQRTQPTVNTYPFVFIARWTHLLLFTHREPETKNTRLCSLALFSLHWLLIKAHICYKFFFLTHNVLQSHHRCSLPLHGV